MNVSPLLAEGDLVGGRIRVSWTVSSDTAGEVLSTADVVELRRKHRDFEFPVGLGEPDPSIVFSSAPGFADTVGTVEVFDVAPVFLPSKRLLSTVHTVSARSADGVFAEVLRWTRTLEFDDAGRAIRIDHVVLDSGASATGLEPGRPCYYELRFTEPLPGDDVIVVRRAIATPTARHRSATWLYDSLPSIYTRHDTVIGPGATDPNATGPVSPFPGVMPEARSGHGQLRRFLDVFGCAIDHLRSRGEGLTGLRDIDSTDARLLPVLAAWIGWDLSVDQPIPLQRHEVRYAAHLYRITGTLPGTRVWVRRLTGWDADVKEFWPNVFLTNDLGDPHDPRDRGSRSVDTSDPDLIGSLGTARDRGDYTHDSSAGGRYAFNKLGIFVSLEPAEEVGAVRDKKNRLADAQSVFLPSNMEAVVVVRTEFDTTEESVLTAVTATAETDS